ncbi:putative calmodulin-like protein 6, partial [Lamellibrachia satsuma]
QAGQRKPATIQLSSEQIAEYRAAFRSIDIDGSGTISVHELGTAMRNLGERLTDDDIRAMIREADEDYSGNIDFDEFVTMMASKPRPKSEEELVAEAFRRFDVDGDGVLTVDELRQGMISLGEDMTDEEIEDMMRAADVNGDGVIDY